MVAGREAPLPDGWGGRGGLGEKCRAHRFRLFPPAAIARSAFPA